MLVERLNVGYSEIQAQMGELQRWASGAPLSSQ
jgi:hypothetical protein